LRGISMVCDNCGIEVDKEGLCCKAGDMKLLTKLGLCDINTLSERELEAKIALDQQLRTRERKKAQKKYGAKKSGGKKA